MLLDEYRITGTVPVPRKIEYGSVRVEPFSARECLMVFEGVEKTREWETLSVVIGTKVSMQIGMSSDIVKNDTIKAEIPLLDDMKAFLVKGEGNEDIVFCEDGVPSPDAENTDDVTVVCISDGKEIEIKTKIVSDRNLKISYSDTAEKIETRNFIENGIMYSVNSMFVDRKTLEPFGKPGLGASDGRSSIYIPIVSEPMYGLGYEMELKEIFDDRVRSLIPPIKDMEKKCFSLGYADEYGRLVKARRLVVNLFFRDREGEENWSTNDTMGWVQRPDIDTPPEATEEGDLIGYLGFSDDDVRYQKSRLSMSFIRLCLYNTYRRDEKMLYEYRTMFFDTSRLRSCYTAEWKDKSEYEKRYGTSIEMVKTMDDERIFGEVSPDMRLSARFSASERNTRTESSDGFYRYLYPSVLNEKDDYGDSTMWMTIDFSHAGYGKTISMIMPDDGEKQIGLESGMFPTSFTKIDEKEGEKFVSVDMTAFNRALHIPVKFRYDTDIKDYIYWFPTAAYDGVTGTVTINAYEPRINGF